jgi:hypothetical protein
VERRSTPQIGLFPHFSDATTFKLSSIDADHLASFRHFHELRGGKSLRGGPFVDASLCSLGDSAASLGMTTDEGTGLLTKQLGDASRWVRLCNRPRGVPERSP